jgi:ubiquinone/menaquinone biosynthesis C-methylase UbiE
MAELSEEKQRTRKVWGTGDYPSIAELIASAGAKAVEAAKVKDGEDVLDVACGAGNATIPAAQTGAHLTGLDLTPELLEAGRAAAADAGVEIEWIEGDAEQLPFEDASFDVVLSVFGCMFAPDHRKTAGELARVLRPGGRLTVLAWTPEGAIGQFFATMGKHMPPPPEGFQPPILWGTEDHVEEIFEGTGVELDFERSAVDLSFDGFDAYMEEYEAKFGPIVVARSMLEPEGKWEALREDLRELNDRLNTSDSGKLEYSAEYLITLGRKA